MTKKRLKTPDQRSTKDPGTWDKDKVLGLGSWVCGLGSGVVSDFGFGISNFLRRRLWDLATYALYLALTLIIAAPVLQQPAARLFASHGDALMTLSWLWWFKTAWLNNLPANPNPMVAAPFGTEWGSVIEKGTVWPGVALSALVNETFAFNVMVLISFPLAAVAMYHLVLYLTENRPAAVVSGLIYAFSPYHLWKSWAWIPLSNIQWLAFYALALLKFRYTQQARNAVLAGFWLAITLLCSYVYGAVAMLLTLVYVAFEIIYAYVSSGRVNMSWRVIRQVGLALGVAGGIVLPVIFPLLPSVLTPDRSAAPLKSGWPLTDLYGLTARVSDYLLPPTSSWFYSLFAPLDAPATGRGDFTNGLFIGYSVLALCGVGVWGWWCNCGWRMADGGLSKEEGIRSPIQNPKSKIRNPSVPLFSVILITALIISIMPPTVGISLPGVGDFVIKEPGYFGYVLAPWFREYARFGVLVILAAAVLAGFGVKYLLARWPRRSPLLVGLVSVGLLLDFGFRAPDTFPLNTSLRPEVYRWLAEQPGDVIIAEYPVARASQVSPVYLFYLTVHGKRIVNGHGFSHKSNLLMPALWNPDEPQTASVLRYLGAEYALWHTSWPGFDHWRGVLPQAPLSEADFEVVRQFDTAIVLRVRAEPARVIVAPGEGFTQAPDPTLEAAWWWITESARLNLLNVTEAPLEISLRFRVTSLGEKERLVAYDMTRSPLPMAVVEGARPQQVMIGPLSVPPSHLMKSTEPVTLPIFLVASGQRQGQIGLREFEVVVSGK